MWYIYKNAAGQYTVCQTPSGGYNICVFGPTSWAGCAAQMKKLGAPGW